MPKDELVGSIDTYISAYVQNGDFSGNVLIIKGDKILFDRSYGLANYELGVRIQRDTKFRMPLFQNVYGCGYCVAAKQERLNFLISLVNITRFIGADSISILHLLLISPVLLT
jgi:hypothetical protein